MFELLPFSCTLLLNTLNLCPSHPFHWHISLLIIFILYLELASLSFVIVIWVLWPINIIFHNWLLMSYGFASLRHDDYYSQPPMVHQGPWCVYHWRSELGHSFLYRSSKYPAQAVLDRNVTHRSLRIYTLLIQNV